MSAIGVMAMPANFQYREVFLRGKPQHDRYDPFRLRHPRMDTGHRAKIFSPFDALRGFNEAVAAKDVRYEDRVEIDPEKAAELDRRLGILRNLTYNGRMARMNRIRVTVTYYEPCTDENHEACGRKGQYITVSGICWNVDTEAEKTIVIDRQRIALENVLRIESESGIFRRQWPPEPGYWDEIERGAACSGIV